SQRSNVVHDRLRYDGHRMVTSAADVIAVTTGKRQSDGRQDVMLNVMDNCESTRSTYTGLTHKSEN
ncbi:hypothetical protein RDWZM_005368, partial [Blomia tropicalis]